MTYCVNSKKDDNWWRKGGIKRNRAKRRRIGHSANDSEPQANGTDTESDGTDTESNDTDTDSNDIDTESKSVDDDAY